MEEEEGEEEEEEAHPFDAAADIGGALRARKVSLRLPPQQPQPHVERRAMGILVRIWYLEEGQDVNTGEIVGYTFMDAATLADPPLGRRSFPIEPTFPIKMGSMYDRDLASGLRERKRKMLVRETGEEEKEPERVDTDANPDADAAAAPARDTGVFESQKQLLTAKLQVTKRVKGTNAPRSWRLELLATSCLPQCLEAEPEEDAASEAKRRKVGFGLGLGLGLGFFAAHHLVAELGLGLGLGWG